MPRGWAILLGLVALGGLLGGWALWRRHVPSSPAAAMTPNVAGISLQLKKVRIFGVSGGKIIWEVEAEHFDIDKNQDTTTMTGLRRVAVLDEKKKEALLLTADRLVRNNITNTITLNEKVTLSGPQLVVHTEEANWFAAGNELMLPRPLDAQFGEYALTAQGPTTYDVVTGQLVVRNPLQLSSGDNVLNAAAATVMTKEQQFSLTGPGTASLVVADMDAWMNGKPLPKIPEIPADIRARYTAYQQAHAPGYTPGVRSFGGFRP